MYYIGLTTDVDRRLEEHNHPSINKKYTAKHLPWELKLFFECSDSRGNGLIIERFLKKSEKQDLCRKANSREGKYPVFR